ncbi:MAG: hypothetical protein GX053_12765 [Tissierella sp.]|nr:hypothetical protein [Tissierella sp.]
MKIKLCKGVGFNRLREYGFEFYPTGIEKEIEYFTWLVVDEKTRELNIRTPLGFTDDLEKYREYYQDLLDDKIIEIVKG